MIVMMMVKDDDDDDDDDDDGGGGGGGGDDGEDDGGGGGDDEILNLMSKMTAFSNNKITAHLPLLFPCALCQRSLWPEGPPISAELEPPSEKETTINTPLVHAHCKITVFWDKTDHPLDFKSYCFLKRKPLA